MAIIPYVTPQTPMDFIKSQVEKSRVKQSVKNDSITSEPIAPYTSIPRALFTSRAISTALIPYTRPQTSTEFIRSEVKKGLKNGAISLNLPRRKIEQLKAYSRSLPPMLDVMSAPCERGRRRSMLGIGSIPVI